MLQNALKMQPHDDMLKFWYSSDSQPKPVPNLCDRSHTSTLINECADYDLVFLDNVAVCSARGADLNKIEEVEPIRDFATGLQHRGISCVLVHHLGKDQSRGAQRQFWPRGFTRHDPEIESICKCAWTSSLDHMSRKRKARHHSPSEFGPIDISR